MAIASNILSIRLSDEEKDLLQSAATDERTSLSDFVRRQAIEAAELRMMERRIVTIPAEAWSRFEAWSNAEPRANPQMADLARHRPAWDD